MDNTIDSVLQNGEINAVAVESVKDDKNAALKKEMKAVFASSLEETPDLAQKIRRLSSSIRVNHTLGYGLGGNLVVDKEKSTADNRVLSRTSKIYGYEVENIGSEAIEYKTEVWTKDENGKYVGEVVKRTFAPGQVIFLTRQYMTMLCAIPEISFTLANGKIIRKKPKAGNNKQVTLVDELKSYYFSFDKDETTGIAPQVNDDEVKLAIDVDGVVKDEYVETFGYLNNPKEAKAASTRAKTASYTAQDIAANFINQLIKKDDTM